MCSKTVLIITNAWAPDADAETLRTIKFVKYLPRFGWKPLVLPVHIKRSRRRDPNVLKEIPDDAEVLRLGNPLALVASHCAHALAGDPIFGAKQARFKSIASAIRRIAAQRTVNACYVTTPPIALCVCALAAAEAGLPLVLDYQDPPFVLEGSTRKAKNQARQTYLAETERDCFRKAASVIVNTAPVKNALRREGSCPDEIVAVIPNGYDEEDFTGSNHPTATEFFELLYAGRVYEIPEMAVFVKGLERACSKNEEFKRQTRFIVLGGTGYRQAAREGCAAHLIEEKGWVSKTDVATAVSRAAVCLLSCPKETTALRVPQKLYEYLRGAREIVALVHEGPAADIVRATQTGLVVPPDDADAITRGLLDAFQRWKSGSAPHKNLKEIRRFERSAQTARLASLLEAAWKAER